MWWCVELQKRVYLYLYETAVPVLFPVCAWIQNYCLEAIEVKHYVHGGICVVYIVIMLPSGREALYRLWAHIYFWALTNSSFVWRAVRIIQGPSIGAFQLALKRKLAMFMNNPSANWWSAKMINRLGIDCLLHKTINLALLSTGFSPEQTLNIYQHSTAGSSAWVALLRWYREHTH